MENLGRVTPATALVLEALLTADSIWGLQIVKDVGKKPGTVYPILERLETAGWVKSEWDSTETRKGPRRRYYRLLAEAQPLAKEYVATHKAKIAPSAGHPSPALLEGQWVGA